METVRDTPSLRAATGAFRAAGERVALVPTMGALHAGHLALVAAGRQRADRVLVSIFVNPKQFSASEDLGRYPRREAEDTRLLEAAGCDLLFLPSPEAIYPPGFATTIHVEGLDRPMEGAARPGHFDGVATVVLKLLLLATPDIAIFGEKDWQQLQLLRRLARDLDLGVEIAAVPVVREPDGLAFSSRNAHLSAAERTAAAALPQAVQAAATALATGEDADAVLAGAKRRLLSAGFRIDYLTLADGETLAPLESVRPGARLFVAASIGSTRLIDNMAVPPPAPPPA